jgi:hypothetical protein
MQQARMLRLRFDQNGIVIGLLERVSDAFQFRNVFFCPIYSSESTIERVAHALGTCQIAL